MILLSKEPLESNIFLPLLWPTMMIYIKFLHLATTEYPAVF